MKTIMELIKKSNKIIAFTGAGVSTNTGIPDFRGPKGLYTFIQERYNLPFGEAIFDIEYFRQNPAPFYDFSSELFTTDIKPSVSHFFLAWLEEQGKLDLVVTQNIDWLHQRAGSSRVLECHGSYGRAHCMSCNNPYEFSFFEGNLRYGTVPYCSCGGVIKPDVVFFGENLPEEFYRNYRNPPSGDLLLVMGTSLSVQPAADFVLRLTQDMPSILINNQTTGFENLFTHCLHKDVDLFSQEVWDSLRQGE